MLSAWIQSIVIFTIFFSLVLYLVPEEKYKKYIQSVIGIVMIVVVITPVLKLLSSGKKLDLEYEYAAIGSFVTENDNSYYQDVMEEMVSGYLEEQYGISCDVVLQLDDAFQIQKMELTITEKNAGTEEITLNPWIDLSDPEVREKFISEISKEYGMSEEDIFIY